MKCNQLVNYYSLTSDIVCVYYMRAKCKPKSAFMKKGTQNSREKNYICLCTNLICFEGVLDNFPLIKLYILLRLMPIDENWKSFHINIWDKLVSIPFTAHKLILIHLNEKYFPKVGFFLFRNREYSFRFPPLH